MAGSNPLRGQLEESEQFCPQVMWQETPGCTLQQHSLGSLPDGGRSPLQLFLCLLHRDHNPDAEKDKNTVRWSHTPVLGTVTVLQEAQLRSLHLRLQQL